MREDSNQETISAYFVFFSFLLALVQVLSKVLHDHPRLASILPEAGMTILVGMMAGWLIHAMYGDQEINAIRGREPPDDDSDVDTQEFVRNILSFSPKAFFVALLPPIIFNSGYHLRRELFFRHLVPILLLACVGTLVSTLVVAALLKMVTLLGLTGDFVPTLTELLTFGALISSTDPVSTLAVFQAKRVDPHLFYLVFGESVLNDAAALVLFDTFSRFVRYDSGAGTIAIGLTELIFDFVLDSLVSPTLGWLCGIGAALLFKYLNMHQHRLLEVALYVLIMYVPFLMATMFGLSGIVAILFTGIAARHYVEPNLSEATQEIADVLFRLSAHLAETSIFLELGLSVFGLTVGVLPWRFMGWSLVACLIARACHVYPISYLFNKSLRKEIDHGDPTSLKGVGPGGGYVYADGLLKFEQESPVQRKFLAGNTELTQHLNDFSNEDTMPEELDRSGKPPSPASPHLHIPLQNVDSELTDTSKRKRDLKIQPQTAHMLWFSGLRGAVAYACVRSFPETFDHQRQFIATTMMIVLATVFCMGGATTLVLFLLKIETNVNEDDYMEAWQQSEQAPKPGLWTYVDKWIQRLVIRHDIMETSPADDDVDRTSAAEDGSASGSSCKSLNTASRRVSVNCVEMTESDHYDNLQEPSIPKAKRKTSLFDYGLKSD